MGQTEVSEMQRKNYVECVGSKEVKESMEQMEEMLQNPRGVRLVNAILTFGNSNFCRKATRV